MTKLFKVLSLMIFALFLIMPLHHASAAGNPWYWISSDSKFSKFFNPGEVKVIAQQDGIPTLIQDYIKTSYSAAGAAETIQAMKLNIKNPADLSYSIAKVWVNPQNRTISYMEETFYNKDGKALYKNIPAQPRHKPINSQAFDEKFYTYIVDQVYHQGETKYLNSPQRWLTIWDNGSGDNAADTSTMYQIKNNVITWLWRNNKTGGKVTSIIFAQKEFDLKNNSVRTLYEYKWTPDTNWQTVISTPDTKMRPVKAKTVEGEEFAKIRSFALRNPIWTYRYQLYNPALKQKPSYAVDSNGNFINQGSAKAKTESPATAPKTEAKPAAKKPADVKPATSKPAEPAPAEEDLPLGSYGPIGPVAS